MEEEALLFFLLGVVIVLVKSIWLLLFIIGSPFISFSFSDVRDDDCLRRLLGGEGGTLALRRANRADDAARLFDDVGLVVVVFVMTLLFENSTFPTLFVEVVTMALLLGCGGV